MTGSPGHSGQHPHSGHQSGVHPAGRALRPEVAHPFTPRHPSVCTPWLTDLRYGETAADRNSDGCRKLRGCIGALGFLKGLPSQHRQSSRNAEFWKLPVLVENAGQGLLSPQYFPQPLLSCLLPIALTLGAEGSLVRLSLSVVSLILYSLMLTTPVVPGLPVPPLTLQPLCSLQFKRYTVSLSLVSKPSS